MTAILDTSFPHALSDLCDRSHVAAAKQLQNANEPLVLSNVVLPEVCHLINVRCGYWRM